MNREEAIKELTDLLPEEFLSEYTEAIKIGIEALEQQPCDDCIRRSDIGLTDFEIVMCNGDYKEGLKMLLDKIEKAPSVTPQPKMGRWIEDVDKWGDVVTTVNGYRCDKCNTFNADKDNYCPYCGAKMSEIPTGAESEEV